MRHEFRIGSMISLVLACGVEQKPQQQSSTAPTQVEVRPPTAQLAPNDAQQFTLSPSTVQVVWSVVETSGGNVTQAGLYTAPPYSGVFHVVATSTANSAISGQAVVTVDSGVRLVATTPASAFACEAVALKATISGSADNAVVWSAPASCGTITSAGIFTSLRGSGPCLVTAQAHADAAQIATVTVNVAPERVLSVAVVPASTSVALGGSQAFSANVTTACGTFPAGT
jgi:hypothetical protein